MLFAVIANATTYYVSNSGRDTNPGTIASPFLTISHAAAVAAAGDTVVVENGNYPEQVTFNANGTSTSPITFRSQTRWGALVSPTGPGLVFNINSSYIVIQDFEITDSNADTLIKFQDGGTGGQALGNKLHDFGTTVAACDGGAAILATQNNAIIDSNFVYSFGPLSNTCWLWDGIYVGDGNGVAVTNNIVVAAIDAGAGIQFNGEQAIQPNFPSDEILSNNDVVNIPGDGIYISCWLAGTCDNNIVTNNILYFVDQIYFGRNPLLKGGGGNIFLHANAGTFGSDNLYSNNLIYYNTTETPQNILAPGQTLIDTVSADPLFVDNTGNATGNYQLQPGSLAISAGISTGCPVHDFNGNQRIGICSIGAYAASW